MYNTYRRREKKERTFFWCDILWIIVEEIFLYQSEVATCCMPRPTASCLLRAIGVGVDSPSRMLPFLKGKIFCFYFFEYEINEKTRRPFFLPPSFHPSILLLPPSSSSSSPSPSSFIATTSSHIVCTGWLWLGLSNAVIALDWRSSLRPSRCSAAMLTGLLGVACGYTCVALRQDQHRDMQCSDDDLIVWLASLRQHKQVPLPQYRC